MNNINQHTIEETHKNEHTREISWKIPKFRRLIKSNTIAHKVGINKSSEVRSSEFRLRMSFLRNNLVKICFASINSIYLKYTLVLKCLNEENVDVKKNIQSREDFHLVKANEWQHCLTCITDQITNSDADSTLHLVFVFLISREPTKDDYNHITPTPQLIFDFENLLTDGNYSDVTMKSSEGVEFKVHKNILSVRSKVLKAYFEHNTSESITNIVETAWETEVLREVLTFVYTEKSPRIKDFPEKLLAAADYFQLERLKRICEAELTKKLTVENAIDTLQYSDIYSAYCLRESTLEFIKNGRGSLVMDTESWEDIESVKLVKMMNECFYVPRNNSDILAVALQEISNS